MGSLGTTQLISLMLAVAVVAALSGFFAAIVARRTKRRTRKIFLVGVFCGLLAGEVVRGRRRGLQVLTAITHRDRRVREHGGVGRFRARALIAKAKPFG